jgi:hypothetical protein
MERFPNLAAGLYRPKDQLRWTSPARLDLYQQFGEGEKVANPQEIKKFMRHLRRLLKRQ